MKKIAENQKSLLLSNNDSTLTIPVKASYMKPLEMKPQVETTHGSMDEAHSRIIISGLPVVSDNVLLASPFIRICHTLKRMYMDPGYVKHQDFLKKIHGKAVKRPKWPNSLCVYYTLRYTDIGDTRHPSKVSIDLLPCVNFPSAHVPCTQEDPRVFCSISNGATQLYWRPMSPLELSTLMAEFTTTCSELVEDFINAVWDPESHDEMQFFRFFE